MLWKWIGLFCSLVLALNAREYVFAMYPSNDPSKIVQALSPLMEYLHEKTGDTFRIAVTKDYEELAQRIQENSVDFAWINTRNYVKIKEQAPSLHYLATYQEHAKSGHITPYYQAYIVTLKATNITSLEEGKDEHFAFTDKDSTSGYAYPLMILEDRHIDPYTFFKKVFFLKKHDKVVEALVNHSIEIGAMSDGTYFNAVAKYGDIFTILAVSEPIPLDAIVATKNTPKEIRKSVEKALIEMPSDAPSNEAFERHLGWPSAGFVRKSDAFYETFRRIAHDHLL